MCLTSDFVCCLDSAVHVVSPSFAINDFFRDMNLAVHWINHFNHYGEIHITLVITLTCWRNGVYGLDI